MGGSRVGLAIALLVSAVGPAAFADLGLFTGTWTNGDPDTRGLATLVVGVRGARVWVHAWGTCRPTDCDWGTVEAHAYGPSASSDPVREAQAVSAEFRTGSSQTLVTLRPAGPNRLRVETLTRFTDRSGRANYGAAHSFVRGSSPGRRPGARPAPPPPTPVQPATPAQPAGAVRRAILPDGTVEVRYPDGTVKRFSRAGVTVVTPDGRERKALFVQVQPPTPPLLPGDAQAVTWLEGHNQVLLGLMRSLVAEEDVGRYLAFEQTNAGTDLYRQINLRSEAIDYLLSP